MTISPRGRWTTIWPAFGLNVTPRPSRTTTPPRPLAWAPRRSVPQCPSGVCRAQSSRDPLPGTAGSEYGCFRVRGVDLEIGGGGGGGSGADAGELGDGAVTQADQG